MTLICGKCKNRFEPRCLSDAWRNNCYECEPPKATIEDIRKQAETLWPDCDVWKDDDTGEIRVSPNL